MLPPDFIKRLEEGGVHPHHCMTCAHAADFERWLVCLKYGAYVLLYSSCGSFERGETGLRIVKKEDVRVKFEWGLVDLRGRKGDQAPYAERCQLSEQKSDFWFVDGLASLSFSSAAYG